MSASIESARRTSPATSSKSGRQASPSSHPERRDAVSPDTAGVEHRPEAEGAADNLGSDAVEPASASAPGDTTELVAAATHAADAAETESTDAAATAAEEGNESAASHAADASVHTDSVAASGTVGAASDASSAESSSAAAAAGASSASISPSGRHAASFAAISADPATKVRREKVLFRQTATGHTTTIRALVHTALSEMERYRRGPGLMQEGDLMCYWESWAGHMGAVHDGNERLLGFVRGLAAASAHWHAAATASAALLGPLSSGESLLAGGMSHAGAASGAGGKGDGGGKAAGGKLSSGGSGFSLLRPRSSSGSSSAGAASAAASGAAAGGSHAAVPSTGLPSAGGDLASVSSARHGLSLSVLSAATAELAGQACGQMHGLAGSLSCDVAGDVDGPLGRKGDGAHASFAALAEKNAGFRAGACATPMMMPPRPQMLLRLWFRLMLPRLPLMMTRLPLRRKAAVAPGLSDA